VPHSSAATVTEQPQQMRRLLEFNDLLVAP